MLDLDYPDPMIPGPAPPGRRPEAPSPSRDPMSCLRARLFDLVTDHPRKFVMGWFALVALFGFASNRSEWITWGVFIPAMVMIAMGAAAVAIRMLSDLRPRSRRT